MFIYCCSQKQVILLFVQQNSALWGYEKFICIECMCISQFKRFQFVKTNSPKIRQVTPTVAKKTSNKVRSRFLLSC